MSCLTPRHPCPLRQDIHVPQEKPLSSPLRKKESKQPERQTASPIGSAGGFNLDSEVPPENIHSGGILESQPAAPLSSGGIKEDGAPGGGGGAGADRSDLSDEDYFWTVLKPKALGRGITVGQLTQLAREADDYRHARRVLEKALRPGTRSPGGYIANAIRGICGEHAAQDAATTGTVAASDEPELIQGYRRAGIPVERRKLPNGKLEFRAYGETYDENGNMTGF